MLVYADIILKIRAIKATTAGNVLWINFRIFRLMILVFPHFFRLMAFDYLQIPSFGECQEYRYV